MAKIFGSPKMPEVETVEDEDEDQIMEDVQKDLRKERRKLRTRRGRASTILTKMNKDGTLLGGN